MEATSVDPAINSRHTFLLFKTPDIQKSAQIEKGDQITVVGLLKAFSVYSPPKQRGATVDFVWFRDVVIKKIVTPKTRMK
jgi:hypothetical protein